MCLIKECVIENQEMSDVVGLCVLVVAAEPESNRSDGAKVDSGWMKFACFKLAVEERASLCERGQGSRGPCR